MTIHNVKLFIGSFLLLIYISIGVFGLFEFNHIAEMPMINCPYAENNFSICNNSFEHIENWQQFSNTTFSSIFIFSVLVLLLVLFFFNKESFLKRKQYFYKWKYYLYNKRLSLCANKIIKWLSLFENSPAFIYARHS